MPSPHDDRARRHPQVVNLDELPGHAIANDVVSATMKPLAAAAHGTALGCTHYEVPPGRSGFPPHYHCVNEEALFVLGGEATLRLGAGPPGERREVKLRAGDYVALPVGPGSSHQLVNTGATALRYLCFSTMQPTDVTIYPETGTTGVLAAPSIEASRRGEVWVSLMVNDGVGTPPAGGGGSKA